jgi:hypothetical protein
MSAEIVNANANASANTSAKVKKVTLSAKYTKFLVFGHWLINQLNLEPDNLTRANDTLRLFESTTLQNDLFESFFNDINAHTKLLKNCIKLHNKPAAKPKKEKKPPSEKKTKTKKHNDASTDPQDALVALIVQAAMTEIAPGAEQHVVTRKDQGGEALVDDSAKDESSKVQEEPTKKKLKVVTKKAPKATEDVDKTAKLAEKEAAKLAEKEAKLEEKAAKEAAKLEEKAAKLEEKAAKEAAKLVEKEAKPKKKAVAKAVVSEESVSA